MANTIIRAMIRGAYDLQKNRIEAGNRLNANFRSKFADENGEITEEGKDIIKTLLVRYDTITEGIVDFTRRGKLEYDGLISNYTELCLVRQYAELLKNEKRHFKDIENALRDHPIYTEFLSDVRGVGPATAGVLLSEVDIEKADTIAALWAYCGLDVVDRWYLVEKDGLDLDNPEHKIPNDDCDIDEENGIAERVGPDGTVVERYEVISMGRSRRREHLVDREYTTRNGEIKTRKSITFNPFLKTKLVGVLGPSFLKAGSGKYRDIYDSYKERISNEERHKDKTPAHIHNMAIRRMVKAFLKDFWVAYRINQNLPVTDPHQGDPVVPTVRK